MGLNIMDLSGSANKKKIVLLIAFNIFNAVSTFSLFVLLIGLVLSAGIMIICSAILFGAGIGFSLFVYKKNITKISLTTEQNIITSVEEIEQPEQQKEESKNTILGGE